MNMWTSFLCIHLCTGLIISSSAMCFTNLIQVDIDLGHQHNGHGLQYSACNMRHNASSANQSLKDKPSLRYDPSVLKTICHNISHDQRYKILPFGAIARIRELKINNRLSRKKALPRIRHTPTGINHNNLIPVVVTKDSGTIHDTQLRIGTINIRSIKRNDQLLLREIIYSDLDISIATESWLKDTEADQIWAQGCDFNRSPFQCHHANRHGRTGGGLMLICKSTMDVKEIQSQNTRSFEHATWSVSINNKSLTINGIYHPPAKDGITNAMFINDVTEHLSEILTNKQNNIILGDFNIHIDDPLDPEAGIFNDTMSALGLIQQVTCPTHTKGNTLDLIFSEMGDSIQFGKIHSGPMLTDHAIVFGELNLKKLKATTEVVTFRKIAAITDEMLLDEFNENIPFDDQNQDLDQLITNLNDELKRVIDTLAPPKRMTLSTHPRQPWYNDTVKTKHKVTRKRERAWLKYKQDSNWIAYKKERNIYNRLLTYSKRQSLCKKINDLRGNTKELYKLTANLTGKAPQNPMPEDKSDAQLAEEFAEFFIDKIDKIRRQFHNTVAYISEEKDVPQLKQFDPVTDSTVEEIINSMHSKSCELDAIPTPLLKRLMRKCLPFITKIVNISLTHGIFSNNWKVAIVRPLLKKAGLVLINKNYRPVSNLSFLSKLVEKCVLLQFNAHCDRYGLIPDFQSAYRKGYSTETGLIKLCNDLLWSMERQEVTMIVLLDLSAAFDTVDHDILLTIFKNHFGIADTALQWYDKYLRPRKMKVCVNASYSNELSLKYGVPQGSCSGANNFVAYCAPIEDIVKEPVSINGYADDHSLRRTFNPNSRADESQCVKDLQISVQDIGNWMTSMRLKLNCDKTELILFGSRQQLLKCKTSEIELDGYPFSLSQYVKYLGGGLDSTLSFKKHIGNVTGKAMANFFRIRGIRKYLNKDACQTLLLGLCISHLDYTNAILYGLPDVDIDKLQRIQTMCAKLVLNRKKSDSATEALKELHWIPVRLRITFKLLMVIHRCLHGDAPKYLKDLLIRTPAPERNLRSSIDTERLIIPRIKLKTFASRAFSVAGPTEWNKLPLRIRHLTSYGQFKKEVKTHLFISYYS